MAGSVSVLNVYSQSLVVSINGLQIAAGTIPAWSLDGGLYRPNVASVPRVLNASDGPGKFFNGNNSVALQWMDGMFFASLRIDGAALPLNQNLLLFITRNAWQLVSEYGTQISTGSVLAFNEMRDIFAAIPES